MRRRDMLLATGAALGLSAFPLGWVSAEDKKKAKVLYFTRSAGFEHGAVRRQGDALSFSEKTLVELGGKHDVEVICSKDGTLFDGDLDQYDAIAFYTSGDLTKPNKRETPPMSTEGKQNLLDWISAGGGFVGFHSATDSFHSPGGRGGTTPIDQRDPYILMIGGEFVSHGPQQEATMRVTSPEFPGAEPWGRSTKLHEEWYALKNFAPDLHVILVQETEGMSGGCYQRPAFPSTWARKHGKGRVFYTALGHRDDIWTNPICQDIIGGGFRWVMGQCDVDVPANIDAVTPDANKLTA